MRYAKSIFMFLFLLICVNFFDFFNLTSGILSYYVSVTQKRLLLILVLLFFIIFLIIKSNPIDIDKKPQFSLSVYYLFGFFFIVSILTSYFYPEQSLTKTFSVSYYGLIPLAYFIFRKILKTKSDWKKFTKLLSIFGTILAITKLIQSFILSNFGVLIFHLNYQGDISNAAYKSFKVLGFIRLPSVGDFLFWVVVILLSLSVRFPEWKILKHPYQLGTMIFCLVTVAQTRTYTLLLVGILVIYIYFRFFRYLSKDLKIIFFFISSITAIIALYLLFSYLINFQVGRSQSFDTRGVELNYYLGLISKSPIFGVGFLRGDGIYRAINAGPFLNYYFSDVGIIGFLAQTGLLGGSFILVLLVQLISSLRKSKKVGASLIICAALIGSFIMRSLLLPDDIAYLTVYLALLEFLSLE